MATILLEILARTFLVVYGGIAVIATGSWQVILSSIALGMDKSLCWSLLYG